MAKLVIEMAGTRTERDDGWKILTNSGYAVLLDADQKVKVTEEITFRIGDVLQWHQNLRRRYRMNNGWYDTSGAYVTRLSDGDAMYLRDLGRQQCEFLLRGVDNAS